MTAALLITIGALLVLLAFGVAWHIHLIWRFHTQMFLTFWAQAISLESTADMMASAAFDASGPVREALVVGQKEFARWCRRQSQIHRDQIPLRLRHRYLPEGHLHD